MPKLINNGTLTTVGSDLKFITLSDWQSLEDKNDSAVVLEPDEHPAPLFEHLAEIVVVAVNFPGFMDGRGFSYARELRERGFTGEIRAVGGFIRDQLTYMTRCGFTAFQPDDDSWLEQAVPSLKDFDEHYQASADQPLPLFRRRAL